MAEQEGEEMGGGGGGGGGTQNVRQAGGRQKASQAGTQAQRRCLTISRFSLAESRSSSLRLAEHIMASSTDR